MLLLLMCPRRDSNPHFWLRRPLFYPLNYEGQLCFLKLTKILPFGKIFVSRLGFNNLNFCGFNSEFQSVLPFRKPNINFVPISAVHPVLNNEDLIAEKFRDFDFSSEWQEVSGNNTITDISTARRYKRRIIRLVRS